MEYKIISQIFTLVIVLIVSVYMIYIGVRQIRRVPFIIRGFSTRAAKVQSAVMVFSINAIRYEFDMLFSVTTLFLIILFFLFLYIDYKKYYSCTFIILKKKHLENYLKNILKIRMLRLK